MDSKEQWFETPLESFPSGNHVEYPMKHHKNSQPHRVRPKGPLKSSMKYSTRSADETIYRLATESDCVTERPRTSQSLRRVKTVEFDVEKSTQADAMTSPTQPRPRDFLLHVVGREISQDTITNGAAPGSGTNRKGDSDDPVLTKAGDQLVNRAPTWTLKVPSHEPSTALTTPATRAIQSSDSSYGVVWSDIGAEDYQGVPRKSSVPRVALRRASSTTSGLERVNSKLFEWDLGRRPGLESLAPQIIIFSDDQAHARTTPSAVEDEEDSIWAPPNSQSTSGVSSRLASLPATARASRLPSQDEPEAADNSLVNDSDNVVEDTIEGLSFPASKTSQAMLITPCQTSKKLRANRRLSNLDDEEVRFRGHRDSVTIARFRFDKTQGASLGPSDVRTSNLAVKRSMLAKIRIKPEE